MVVPTEREICSAINDIVTRVSTSSVTALIGGDTFHSRGRLTGAADTRVTPLSYSFSCNVLYSI